MALAFSPDGKLLLSGGGQGDDSVYLWDLETGKRRLRLPVERPVASVAFSPDGMQIAASCGFFGVESEKRVRVWDASSGRELHRLNLGNSAYGLNFSPDGRVLGINAPNDKVLLWELGKPPRRLEGQKGEGHELVFSPDGKRVATGVTEWPNPEDFKRKVFVIRLWDVATGKVVHALRGHEESIRALAFSPDGKRLASGGWEKTNTVRLWDVASGKELPALQKREGDTRALRFSADGLTLHAASQEGELRTWQLPEGKRLPTVQLKDVPHSSDPVAFSPDGSRLAMGNWIGIAGGSNTVNLWDLATGNRILTFAGHEGSVRKLSFSADGKYLASLGGEGAMLWDVAARRPLRRFGVRLDGMENLDLSADGAMLATGSRGEGRVRLWDTATGKEFAGLTWKLGERSACGAPRFSPDGRSLVVMESRPTGLQLFSVPRKRQVHRSSLPDLSFAFATSFTPDGREIVAASGVGIVRWDAASGKERLRLGQSVDIGDIYGYWTDATALSSDGRTLALGARNGMFGLWETATGREIVRLIPEKDYENTITAAGFSPDNRYVIAGKSDGSFRCWDALTGEELANRAAHGGPVFALAFTTGGRTLATVSSDTTILLWDFPALLKARPKGKKLDPQMLEDMWRLLEKDDGRPQRAIAALADAEAVSFLAERLRPLRADRMDRKTIERLIARLDDAKFTERQKAVEALKRFGIRAEMDLKRALEQSPGLEMRRRIEDILATLPREKSTVASGERLRALRSLAALEFTGTAGAQQVLESLAQEAGDSVVRSEAGAALIRLQHAAARSR